MNVKAIIGISPTVTVEITGEGDELFQEIAFWNTIPHECPICDSALFFTFRKATAKAGPHKGKTFPYSGMQCVGDTSHECQFSKREDGSGYFIRSGNRQDGQPNWRDVPYHNSRAEDDDSETGSSPVPFAPPEQTKALETLATQKGYAFTEMNKDCLKKWGVGYKQLSRDQAVEYHATLKVM